MPQLAARCGAGHPLHASGGEPAWSHSVDGYRESSESWPTCCETASDAARAFPSSHRRRRPRLMHSARSSPKPTTKVLSSRSGQLPRPPPEGVKTFARQYGTKSPKTVKKIVDDAGRAPGVLRLPAEHWIHLLTTNPIESTFATVRLRTKVTHGAGSRGRGSRPAEPLTSRVSGRLGEPCPGRCRAGSAGWCHPGCWRRR